MRCIFSCFFHKLIRDEKHVRDRFLQDGILRKVLIAPICLIIGKEMAIVIRFYDINVLTAEKGHGIMNL